MKTGGDKIARDQRYFNLRENPQSFLTTHSTEEFWFGSMSRLRGKQR
jgi:hypothetical protein